MTVIALRGEVHGYTFNNDAHVSLFCCGLYVRLVIACVCVCVWMRACDYKVPVRTYRVFAKYDVTKFCQLSTALQNY